MKEIINIFIGGFNLTDSINNFTKVKGFADNGSQDTYTFNFCDGSVQSFPGFMVDILKTEEQEPKANKYADLFKAKLNNMNLVLFHKHKDWKSWMEDKAANREANPHFMISDNFDYFLCLKQHQDTCLRWLNGGGVKVRPINIPNWNCYFENMKLHSWGVDSPFMSEDLEIKEALSDEEIKVINGKALFNISLNEVKKAWPGLDCRSWGDLDEHGIKYWCGFAESIDFKEKVSK